jgi:hypothetical protein
MSTTSGVAQQQQPQNRSLPFNISSILNHKEVTRGKNKFNLKEKSIDEACSQVDETNSLLAKSNQNDNGSNSDEVNIDEDEFDESSDNDSENEDANQDDEEASDNDEEARAMVNQENSKISRFKK